MLVDNEPGVLARIAGLFSGRGYNIDSLTVSETEHEKHLSRFTIVTTGTSMVLSQIKSQLERLVNVHRVVDLTVAGDPLERELALLKVAGKGEKRIEALRLAEIFRADVIDASTEHFVFEITGRTSKIEQFISIMRELGLAGSLPHRHRCDRPRRQGDVGLASSQLPRYLGPSLQRSASECHPIWHGRCWGSWS